MSFHASLTEADIHTPFAWIWADAAERGTEVVVASDVNKMGYEQDTGNIYLLEDAVPTWRLVSSGAVGALALDDLTDVNAPAPNDGDVLTYVLGSTEWQPVAPSSLGDHIIEDAVTNAISDAVTLTHNSTGVPTDGFGVGLRMYAETDTTPDVDIARISAYWSNLAGIGETAVLQIDGAIAGGYLTDMVVIAAPATLTNTAGNARGDGARDFQGQRSAATYVASGDNSVILAGIDNTASGGNSLIGNGHLNLATNDYGTVINGYQNYVNAPYGIISNGVYNQAHSLHNFIGTGYSNYIHADSVFGAIVGGYDNTINNYSEFGFIGNGYGNTINENSYGIVVGGKGNQATLYDYGIIVGGNTNIVTAKHASIVNGYQNSIVTATGYYSAIINGKSNSIVNGYSFIGTGDTNVVNPPYSAILTGKDNTIYGPFAARYSIILGGNQNIIYSGNNVASFIGTGTYCTIGSNSAGATILNGANSSISYQSGSAAILNGGSNTISNNSPWAFIGVGQSNQIYDHSNRASIITGLSNKILAYAPDSTILSGQNNQIEESFSAILSGTYNQIANVGQVVANNGSSFAALGEAQGTIQQMFSASITHNLASWFSLYVDGSATLATIPNGTVWAISGLVVGTNSIHTVRQSYEIRATLVKTGGVVTILSQTITTVYEDDANFNARVNATGGTWNIQVTDAGASSVTMRWVATIRTAEVGF